MVYVCVWGMSVWCVCEVCAHSVYVCAYTHVCMCYLSQGILLSPKLSLILLFKIGILASNLK